MAKKLTALIIMDGFGLSDIEEGNAVHQARTPNFDKYWNEYPHAMVHASGLDVGLPEGQMGNSEVGHLNLGAGRVVYQDFTRVTKAIKDGIFPINQAFTKAIDNVKANGTKLHLMGLVSDGGVHSHMEHLYALIQLAKEKGIDEVYVHCFMDGRDVPPASGKDFILALEEKLRESKTGKIATIMGRYYAMDRDNRWDRVKKAYDAMVLGKGEFAESATEAMDQSYNLHVTDEFINPTVIIEDGKPVGTIGDKDSIIFFNFRPDRAREFTRSIIEENFPGFEREKGYFPTTFVSMTQYDETFENVHVAFRPDGLENTFGEYISKAGKTQLRIAETEKYAHVTFFFNGGVEEANKDEDRVLIQSPSVATYDMKPSMSAYEVSEEMEERVASGKYDVIILNYANCDMVGHTGIMEAAIEAVETVDTCMGRTVEAIRKVGGSVIITADHGNAEKMIDYSTGEPHTAHTTNPVPLIFVDDSMRDVKIRQDGSLSDITPTLLQLMGLDKPVEMIKQSLIEG